MLSFKYKLPFLLWIAYGSPACAQNMSTPYSVYGIGDIDSRYYNFNAGMGYTGLALKTSLFTAGNNPASASGLEKSFFIFDASAAGRTVTYHGDAVNAANANNHDFTIKKLSLTAKPANFWATGIGFSQFSTVNYSFLSTKSIEGSADKYNISYAGDGGLNNFYWNNAFNIGRHFSAGITTSFIAGPINQTETIIDNSGTAITSKRRDYYANGRLDYGLIYTTPLSQKWNFALGGRYAGKTRLNYERTLNVTEGATALLTEDFIRYTKFSLPQSYGAGIAFANKGGMTIAADYSADNWSALKIKGTNWRLVNSNRISAGVEFASFENSFTKTVQKRSFQLGAFLNNSYLQISNQAVREYGVTTGITRSLKNGLLFSTSLEGGLRGTTQAGLIKETYAQLSLTVSYRDFIYSGGRKYD